MAAVFRSLLRLAAAADGELLPVGVRAGAAPG